MQQTIDHVFETTPERFWDMFLFDDAYHDALYEHMKLNEQQREITRDGDLVTRTIVMAPERDLPGFLKKILRGTSTVRETSVYDPSTHRMDVTVTLPVIGKRACFTGTYVSAPSDNGSFKRTWSASLDVRIPLVGTRIEKYILGQLEDSMARNYAFTTRWLAQKVA